MANLHETAEWVDGIYRIEFEDLVEGGENGVDNRPHKELAKRTLWLKNELEKLQDQFTQLSRSIGNLDSAMLSINGGPNDEWVDDIEKRLEALEAKQGTGSSGSRVAMLDFTLAGENIAQVTEHGKDGSISLDKSTMGVNDDFHVILPADYDTSTHRYTINAYAVDFMGTRSGSSEYTLIGDTDKRLHIRPKVLTYEKTVGGAEGAGEVTKYYISTKFVVEVFRL